MRAHQITIQTYDTYAHAYDEKIIKFWDNFPKDFIELFVASLPGKRVLNLGSGSGRDALLLRAHGIEVICVDASKSMIALTRKLGFESHHVSFLDMSFAANSFDGVWAHGALVHVICEDARLVLQRVHTLLKAGGICALGVIKGADTALLEHSITPGAQRFFQFYTNTELTELVTKLGFSFQHSQEYNPGYDVFLNHLYAVMK